MQSMKPISLFLAVVCGLSACRQTPPPEPQKTAELASMPGVDPAGWMHYSPRPTWVEKRRDTLQGTRTPDGNCELSGSSTLEPGETQRSETQIALNVRTCAFIMSQGVDTGSEQLAPGPMQYDTVRAAPDAAVRHN